MKDFENQWGKEKLIGFSDGMVSSVASDTVSKIINRSIYGILVQDTWPIAVIKELV